MAKNLQKRSVIMLRDKVKGVSIRSIQMLMALLMLVISVLLLFTTFRTKVGYSRMRAFRGNCGYHFLRRSVAFFYKLCCTDQYVAHYVG